MSAEFLFEAIGTKWRIDILEEISSDKQTDVLKEIKERIDLFENTYSRFRSNSLLSKMSRTTGTYSLPNDAKVLFDFYEELYYRTNGLFTPMVGQLLVDAGYDKDYSLKQKKELEKPPEWTDVFDYSYSQLKIKKPTQLDFGALGKGYLIDIVGDILSKNFIKNFCVDAGGDILYKKEDGAQMRIGLENPTDFTQVIGVATIANQSLCGSSGSRRKWQNFHHIFNPETLSSPRNILAVWVVAPKALLADAMATCLFLVSPETLISWYNFDYAVLYADYSISKSKYFPGEFFSR